MNISYPESPLIVIAKTFVARYRYEESDIYIYRFLSQSLS
jgi:hypothetical protein